VFVVTFWLVSPHPHRPLPWTPPSVS
jgi:hypothetical protein